MFVKDLEILKDFVGQSYLGLKFTYDEVEEHLRSMLNLEPDKFETLLRNRRMRDGKDYHMTVLNVPEYNKVGKPTLEDLKNAYKFTHFDVSTKGLGKSEKNGSVAYYVVCASSMVQAFRRGFGLSEKDLHITIGFDPKDVHGVPKNESIVS